MIDDEDDIIRVTALSRAKAEAKAKERAAKEFSTEIRSRMEAEQ